MRQRNEMREEYHLYDDFYNIYFYLYINRKEIKLSRVSSQTIFLDTCINKYFFIADIVNQLNDVIYDTFMWKFFTKL